MSQKDDEPKGWRAKGTMSQRDGEPSWLAFEFASVGDSDVQVHLFSTAVDPHVDGLADRCQADSVDQVIVVADSRAIKLQNHVVDL
jgi:hypothetical protein